MQYRMKSFYFKWVSLTFLGVEPNPGFWPETPTGSCWPWSWHHDGNTTQTLRRSAPPLCLKCCSHTSLLGAPTALPLACWCSHSKLLQEWAGEDAGDTELLDLLHCYLKCTLCVRYLQIPAKHCHSLMGSSFPPDCTITNWE